MSNWWNETDDDILPVCPHFPNFEIYFLEIVFGVIVGNYLYL